MSIDQQTSRVESAGQTQAARYHEIRSLTEQLCAPLSGEDCVVQSMPDASPAKWHLAHTTWFFETFVLSRAFPDRRPFDPQYQYLFNSYYNEVGDRHPRPKRGLLTRPPIDEIYEYRASVDRSMREFLTSSVSGDTQNIIETGLHHEQQHQELILTDVKHLFWCNPLRPAYCSAITKPASPTVSMKWVDYPEGMRSIGHAVDGFCFDHELPQHRVFVDSFALGSRLVSNGEYLSFLDDGGYRRPEFWLSDGWDTVQSKGWQAPFYWEQRGQEWWLLTLSGMRKIDESEPVCHVSFYEADAYARWSGARLPTEAEWEIAAREIPIEGNFVEAGRFHPAPATAASSSSPMQLFGDVWEWTASPFTAYPGYQPPAGALGEYNGKFMCNQIVLRGGSCATSQTHIRATYRNFFKPDARWQFSGIRPARDV
jgi:ergothioneine biosynthesis protein EgtB